ncbi:MFS family permease [Actinomadura coerulea]|uniref:MFS family permease n=1 Tax=Actinomadura coerulea TaxID=46159 RepID=A0A7X0KXJ2_9ACTN|nr:MFS family permease [Actinomadura coerulea]GGQ40857.1 hypothetical protein GCM10010187_68740 [Actinomadura coerulea]
MLAIGVVGFCATFAEGASADWTAVYLTEVTDAGPGLAAAAYTVFMSCMAGTRLLGDRLVRRLGPARVVRCGGVVAVLGGALVVASRAPGPAIAGFALLGVGVATVVPLVFAAAGDAGATPGEGVAGVATITYLSGLTAPAVTGWTAGALSYPAAFALITCVVAVMTVTAGALNPRGGGAAGRPAAETSGRVEKAVPQAGARPVDVRKAGNARALPASAEIRQDLRAGRRPRPAGPSGPG